MVLNHHLRVSSCQVHTSFDGHLLFWGWIPGTTNWNVQTARTHLQHRHADLTWIPTHKNTNITSQWPTVHVWTVNLYLDVNSHCKFIRNRKASVNLKKRSVGRLLDLLSILFRMFWSIRCLKVHAPINIICSFFPASLEAAPADLCSSRYHWYLDVKWWLYHRKKPRRTSSIRTGGL